MVEKQNKFTKRDFFILSLLLLIALVFRLYKINTPLADFHSWRQVDTAAVARNFVNKEFNLLEPKYDDLSNVQSGQENPQGYRMVEFPLYNAIFASLYKYYPVMPLEWYGRMTSIFFSLIVIAVIYYLLFKEVNRFTAFTGGLLYSVFPFFVFFSRVVLPESTALGFTFLSIFTLYRWAHTKNKSAAAVYYLTSLIFFALALLVKPTVIFFLLVNLYIFLNKYRFQILKKLQFYLYFVLTIIPLVWWRQHITAYPEGIPASEWLITHVNTYIGLQNIFFRPAFFRWIFFERIGNLILGGFMTTFLVAGVLIKTKKYLLASIGLASLAYLLTFQGGNVQHEYYQAIILPAVAIFSAIGVNFFTKNKSFSAILTYPLVFFIFIFSFFVSFNLVKGYYDYSSELVSMAAVIKDLTKPEDKIVVDRTGDTTLLYLAERRGAPSIFKEPKELQAGGYKYLVIQDMQAIENIKTSGQFPVLFENDKFTIFKL